MIKEIAIGVGLGMIVSTLLVNLVEMFAAYMVGKYINKRMVSK